MNPRARHTDKRDDRQIDLFDESSKPLPDGLVYRPDFITAEEEAELLAAIRPLPLHEAEYKGYTAKRRILSFGSSYDFDENRLNAAPPFPEFLTPLRTRVAAWLGIPPDSFAHALLTEYRPGTSIGWHRDVPDFAVVVGVSLAGACRLRFRPYPPPKGKSRDAFALDLQPRSAYILKDDIRWKWQHSIPPTKELRYSITLRTPSGRHPSQSRSAPPA